MKRNRKSKKAKFFCEFCGAEVKQNDKVCTNCGKFFASVRCPNCGKTGRTEEFTNGCPECGYAVTPFNNIKLKNKSSLFSSFSKKSNAQTSETSLPLWTYLLVIGLLIIVLICFYSCINDGF